MNTVRKAVYLGVEPNCYHKYRDETNETHFLNHVPRGVQPGQAVTLTYRTDRTSGLWYAESAACLAAICTEPMPHKHPFCQTNQQLLQQFIVKRST
jgi:hypothetical protein